MAEGLTLPQLENRFCSLAEYRAGLASRTSEARLAIDGVYSMVGRLRRPGRHEAVIRPVIIHGVDHVDEQGKQLVHLRFIRSDGSIRTGAHPEIFNGHLTVFGPGIAFGNSANALQPIETAYLGQRLDSEWEAGQVRAMFERVRDLHEN